MELFARKLLIFAVKITAETSPIISALPPSPAFFEVETERTTVIAHQGKGNRCQRQWEFVATLSGQSILPVNFHDGDGHLDQEGECKKTSEQPEQDRDSAEEFRPGRKISHPG